MTKRVCFSALPKFSGFSVEKTEKGISFFKSIFRNFSVCILKAKVSDFHTASPWTVACLAPLSMEFSRQEYWSGLPFPSPVCILNLC